MKNEAFFAYSKIIALLNSSVEKLGNGEIFALEKSIVGSDLRYADIRIYTDTISKGSKRFVVMENDFTFDIMRVECNCNLKKMYELLKPEQNPGLDHARDIVLRLLNVYLDSSWMKAKSISNCIDAKMFDDKVISYSWLQRKTSAISLFKNCGNPLELLRFTVAELVKSGGLAEVDGFKYKTNAKLYRITIARDSDDVPTIIEVDSPLTAIEQKKKNQLAYIAEIVIPKLTRPDSIPLEITDDIVLTFDDIREYLTSISNEVARYGVTLDKSNYVIARTMDNFSLKDFYRDIDKAVEEKQKGYRGKKRSTPAPAPAATAEPTQDQPATPPAKSTADWLNAQSANGWKE